MRYEKEAITYEFPDSGLVTEIKAGNQADPIYF